MIIFRRLALAFVLLAPLSAGAQNLLLNPHFDTDTSNWSVYGGAWDGTRDAANAIGTSGSVLGTRTVSGAVPGIQQCVTATPGTTYGYGGKYFVASGQAVTGVTAPQICFYSAPSCTGAPISCDGLPYESNFDAWTPMNSSILAPAGTVTAIFTFWIGNNADGTFQVSWDDLFFGVGLTPASLTSFSAD